MCPWLSQAGVAQAFSATRAAEVQAALQALDMREAEAGLKQARTDPAAAFPRVGTLYQEYE